MSRVLLAACGLATAALASAAYVVPPANLAPAPYAEWAHYHWYEIASTKPALVEFGPDSEFPAVCGHRRVWLSSDDSNQQNVSNLVKVCVF